MVTGAAGRVANESPEDLAEMRSQLGAALAGLQRMGEAESMLADAYASLLDSLEPGRHALALWPAIERIVDLYDAWHAAEPDTGHDAKAAE